MNKRILSHVGLLGANLIYGVNYSVSKWIMPDFINPFALAVIRVLGGIVSFWLISMFLAEEQIARKDFIHLLLCGIFGVSINQVMFLVGLNYTTPIDASIIMTLNPIVVLIAAYFIINEQISWLKIVGIFIGGAGAILLITSDGHFSFTSDKFIGNLLMVGNTSSYAIYLVIVKPLMKKYRPITVMKWVFLFGSIIIVPIGFREFVSVDYSAFTLNAWIALLYIVLFTTVLAYLLNIFSLKWVSSTLASSYIYTQPVIAGIVSLILSQGSYTWVKFVSVLLVFGGVYFVNKAGVRKSNISAVKI